MPPRQHPPTYRTELLTDLDLSYGAFRRETDPHTQTLLQRGVARQDIQPLLDFVTQVEESYQAARESILQTRVLRPQPPVGRSSQLDHLWYHYENRPDHFRRLVRVSPKVFDRILDLIENDTIFHNQSNYSQAPVKKQLAMFLYRLGHYGNAASVESIADWAGVSVGTVHNYTIRVTQALLKYHDKYICWPSEDEKALSKEFTIQQTHVEAWAGGYLSVDGTAVRLATRPGLQGEAWYSKDKEYSMGLQVVILNHSLRIVDYSVGTTGSTHDSTAFQRTKACRLSASLFRAGEWIWADSAYGIESWLITPFKRPSGGSLQRSQRRFNYYLSRVRVNVEHAIGLLKGRFQSLRELRINIKSEREWKQAAVWVQCCIVLHNLILGDDTEETWEEFDIPPVAFEEDGRRVLLGRGGHEDDESSDDESLDDESSDDESSGDESLGADQNNDNGTEGPWAEGGGGELEQERGLGNRRRRRRRAKELSPGQASRELLMASLLEVYPLS